MIGEEAAKLLWDARGAAERIARFTADRGFDDYLADDMLRAAVERQFEIVGEAFAAFGKAVFIDVAGNFARFLGYDRCSGAALGGSET